MLVAHQGDQGRDDDGQAVESQARKLVAERLARAGRHHHHGVAALERRLHGLALAGAEVLEPEQLVQERVGIEAVDDALGNLHRRRVYRRPRRPPGAEAWLVQVEQRRRVHGLVQLVHVADVAEHGVTSPVDAEPLVDVPVDAQPRGDAVDGLEQ